MDFEIVLESFERWFKGYQLTDCDITNIVMGIILVVLLIVLIVMLVIISIQTLFWTRQFRLQRYTFSATYRQFYALFHCL